MHKYLITAALAISFAAPALAASTFYLQQDAKTHKCSVATTKPDGTAMMMVGKVTFASQADAEAAMKVAKECKA
jgi:hypothetical protein